MATSCHIGRGLSVVEEDDRGIELEGTFRLAPGRVTVLYGMAPVPARGRRVYVVTWRAVRAGRRGLIYRGYCEWLSRSSEPDTRAGSIARL